MNVCVLFDSAGRGPGVPAPRVGARRLEDGGEGGVLREDEEEAVFNEFRSAKLAQLHMQNARSTTRASGHLDRATGPTLQPKSKECLVQKLSLDNYESTISENGYGKLDFQTKNNR